MSPILMELIPDTGATFTATVVIAGIVIVVAALVLLILIFQLFGIVAPKINAASEKREKKKAEKKALITKNKTETSSEPAPKKPAPAVIPAQPVAEDGISGEVVAAISAAIAQIEGGGAVIRSIKKKNVGGRNPWANAANIENTKPF